MQWTGQSSGTPISFLNKNHKYIHCYCWLHWYIHHNFRSTQPHQLSLLQSESHSIASKNLWVRMNEKIRPWVRDECDIFSPFWPSYTGLRYQWAESCSISKSHSTARFEVGKLKSVNYTNMGNMEYIKNHLTIDTWVASSVLCAWLNGLSCLCDFSITSCQSADVSIGIPLSDTSSLAWMSFRSKGWQISTRYIFTYIYQIKNMKAGSKSYPFYDISLATP